MPGKVNPVIPEVVVQVAAQVIGNDAAITVGGMQGNFELNVMVPMLARNLLESIHLLTAATRLLAERCVDGIEADVDRRERHAENTLATRPRSTPTSATTWRPSSSKRQPPRAGRCVRSPRRTASATT